MGNKASPFRRKDQPENSSSPKYLISGQIQREFVISPAGMVYNNFLGGNLSYAFAGLRFWDQSIGLISRLSADFPNELLDWLRKMGADISGVTRKEAVFEQRSFCRVNSEGTSETEKVLAHYSRVGAEYPKSLLNFPRNDINHSPPAYLESEIPHSYMHSELALVLPEDLPSQTAIMTHLGKGSIHKFILSPSAEFMFPQFWDDWLTLFKNLDVLLTSEKNLRILYNEPQKSLWNLTENLFASGVKAVVIDINRLAYWIMEKSSGKRWIIPRYPIQAQYPMGTDSAFAGGFQFGYQKSYDLLEGTIFGLASASLMAGGVTPADIFDALPGLAEARLEILRRAVKFA